MSRLAQSTPLRLALGLVLLFSVVSLLSLAASYIVTQRSFEQTIRDDLRQDMTGFRAAPSGAALAQLVEAEAAETDPNRLVLSYYAANRQHYGNAFIARDDEGYHIVSLGADRAGLPGRYLALTTQLYGGQLTIARSRAEIDALRGVFLNILALSLLPTVLIAISGGLYFARRSARQVAVIGRDLDRLTSGTLSARIGDTPGWGADLAQIARKIDQMARAQEASVETLRQVSSDIAHDLKTPIQRVALHLDDLANRHAVDAQGQDKVAEARAELDRIVAVFHALLQIAQVESGTPKSRFVPVDLRDLCRTFHEVYEPAAVESGHRLRLDLPEKGDAIAVPGDRSLLGQVLANLIENALRHTPPGTVITVGASGGAHPRLWVADTGPGIPEAERGLVLQRLYRLDHSRTTPGSGLGLSLVEVVASVHDATLTLEDNAPGLKVSLRF
ncbi:ATP-binding protein [Thalassococcus sp. BH17M4-6]|uniref:sensor histidine kinase n=1 Tax=Thalassococcus sp. BH17M4-6 TaxID=3413148 RepID=UPI003BE1DC65